MPFELGLAVASAQIGSASHDWFVFETIEHRASKSLSDLSGTDANIHDGKVQGVMRELCNAFVRPSASERYSVPAMMQTYRRVRNVVGEIERSTRARTLFESTAFQLLCAAAGEAALRKGF